MSKGWMVLIIAAVFVAPALALEMQAPASGAASPLDLSGFAKSATKPLVDKSSDGYVKGFVMDAATKNPVAGALVSVERDGKFPDSGNSVATSDGKGKFTAKAPLGWRKKRSKFNLLGAITPLAGPMIKGSSEQSIQLTQLVIKVSALGYKTYTGPARIAYRDPGEFLVSLGEVYLCPEQSAGVSFQCGFPPAERLIEFSLQPSIVDAGGEVDMTARLQVPGNLGLGYQVIVANPHNLFGKKAPVLKLGSNAREGDKEVQLSSSDAVSRKPVYQCEELTASFVRAIQTMVRGFLSGGTYRRYQGLKPKDTQAQPVLVQVVTNEKERQSAVCVEHAYGLVRVEKLEMAAQKALEAVKLCPDYPPARQMAGDILMKQDKPSEAVEHFKRMTDLQPKDYVRAVPRYAEALAASGKADEAKKMMEEISAQFGKDKTPRPEFYAALARCYIATREFGKVDELMGKTGLLPVDVAHQIAFERARAELKMDPNSAQAHRDMGRAYSYLGQLEQAIVEFRAAAAASPNDFLSVLDLGSALCDNGEYDEALPLLKNAISAKPDNAEAQCELGDCYRKLHRYADARPCYAIAAKLQPADFQSRHWYGIALITQGDLNEAVTELTQAIKLASGAREENVSRTRDVESRLSVQSGFAYPEAEADYMILDALDAARANPDDPFVKLSIASALIRLGVPEEAKLLLEECESLNSPEVRYQKALAQWQIGDALGAKAALKEITKENPVHPEAYVSLARVCADLGDGDGAEAALRKHRSNYPNAPDGGE